MITLKISSLPQSTCQNSSRLAIPGWKLVHQISGIQSLSTKFEEIIAVCPRNSQCFDKIGGLFIRQCCDVSVLLQFDILKAFVLIASNNQLIEKEKSQLRLEKLIPTKFVFKYVYSLLKDFPYNRFASRSWTELFQSCLR